MRSGRAAHMQPRSATRMPPAPGAAGQNPLLYVGPWQEYALGAMMAKMRGQTMEAMMELMQEREGSDSPVSGAVSPVDSYVGSISSARSAASSRSVASSTRTSRTDPSSWSSAESGANTALFRRARNLKYKGAEYERPWRSKPQPARKTVKQQNVARMRTMYGIDGRRKQEPQGPKQHPAPEAAPQPQPASGSLPPLPVAQQQAASSPPPLHGRRSARKPAPAPAALHNSAATHRANALARPPAVRSPAPTGVTSWQASPTPAGQPAAAAVALDEGLRSPLGRRGSPGGAMPATPVSPKGEGEVDMLLDWADSIDLANISQELG